MTGLRSLSPSQAPTPCAHPQSERRPFPFQVCSGLSLCTPLTAGGRSMSWWHWSHPSAFCAGPRGHIGICSLEKSTGRG